MTPLYAAFLGIRAPPVPQGPLHEASTKISQAGFGRPLHGAQLAEPQDRRAISTFSVPIDRESNQKYDSLVMTCHARALPALH